MRASICFIAVSLMSAAGVQASPRSDVFEPLPSGAITLKGGLERELRLSQEGWILGDVPYHAFADFFRKGTPQFALGEMWGKFVRSGCMFYRHSRDPRIKARMQEAVADILSTERANGSISTVPVAEQPGGRNGDLWERKYVLLGLEGYYADVEADPRVLAAMRRQADAILAQIGPDPKQDVLALGWSPNHVESSTLLEPMVRLYRLTGETRYLDFAKYLVARGGALGSDLVQMAHDKVPPHLMGGVYPKAYETTSYFEGLADYLRVADDARVHRAVTNYFALVRDRELTIAGNGGADQPYHPRVMGEAWGDTAREQTNPDIKRMMETCTGVTWMKFCSHILRLEADASAAEAIERYVYNGLIGAMKPDGCGFSYVNLLDGHKVTNQGWGWKFSGKPVTCCNLNGPMGLAYIPHVAVMQAAEGPVINLYNGFTAQAKTASGGDVRLEMATDYPLSGAVRLQVTPAKAEAFTIRLRNPACSDATVVRINGQVVPLAARPAAYLELVREWRPGDCIEIDFSLRCKLVKGPRGVNRAGNGRVALVYGPVVLARDERRDPHFNDAVEIIAAADGTVNARRIDPPPTGARLAFEVPTLDGPIVMTDYASVDCWDGKNRVRTWLPTNRCSCPKSH